MNDTFTAYITKYALTAGIQTREVRRSGVSDGMVIDTRNDLALYHGEGKDWHRTPEAAIARAEAMRKAKIASLEKSIAKLRKLKFEVPVGNPGGGDK